MGHGGEVFLLQPRGLTMDLNADFIGGVFVGLGIAAALLAIGLGMLNRIGSIPVAEDHTGPWLDSDSRHVRGIHGEKIRRPSR